MKKFLNLSVIILVIGYCISEGMAARPKVSTYKSRHYEVKTDLGLKTAKKISYNMEAIHAEYIRRLGWLKGRAVSGKFRIIVCEKKADYISLVGKNYKHSGGVFQPGKKLLASFLGERDMKIVFSTLYHEGFHQFISIYVDNTLPVWVNEGLAKYFEYSTRRGKAFTVGEAPPLLVNDIKEAVKNRKYIPFKKLITMGHKEWRDNLGGPIGHLQYSQSWSMIRFIIKTKDGKYQELFSNYLIAIDKGISPDMAFRQIFGANISKFEKAWKSYVLEELDVSSKYVCFRNLSFISYILTLSKNSSIFFTPDRFKNKLLKRKLGSWWVSIRGEKIFSQEKDKVEGLFFCPDDPNRERRKKSSYVFKKIKNAEYPAVVCDFHKGITIYARSVLDPKTGKYRIETDEIRKKH